MKCNSSSINCVLFYQVLHNFQYCLTILFFLSCDLIYWTIAKSNTTFQLGLCPQLSQTSDGGSDWGSSCCWVGPSSSSNFDATVLCAAAPDADSLTLHVVLSTEGAHVFGVLGDFHLLDGLTEGGTITGSVLAHNSDFLGTFGLNSKYWEISLTKLKFRAK